jgi:hypothetical protein
MMIPCFTVQGENMTKRLRVTGLAAVLALVGMATVTADPVYDRCYYVCGDQVYEGYTTYGACCSGGGIPCPGGGMSQGLSWGGYTTLEQTCN